MIIISAKDAADIGKAFEEFIAILLSKLGYTIENMRVRRAGRELDIRASSMVTGSPLLVECKGLSKPLAGPSFSKFYGVYDHEYRKSNSNLTGLIISLTGFNSEVLDYYQEKDENIRERFRIIGPKQILKFAIDADLISDDLTVQHLARRSWPFELGKTLLVITTTQYYRVQLLEKDGKVTHFIVYRAKCEDPTEYEVNMLHQNVRILKKLESFDLSARKQILLALSQAQENTSYEELSNLTKQSVLTVSTELSYLKDRNFVEESDKGRFVLVHDIRVFCEVSKELLVSQYKYDFLLSHYFRQMNNIHLSTYCLSRRFLCTEDVQEHVVLGSVFQYSPASLNQALFGEIERYRVTHEHALQIGSAKPQEIMNIARSSFYTEIMPHLLKDLHDRANSPLHELESIVGLKEEYHIILATTVRPIFDLTAGGITVTMKAGEAIKAGQLVTTDTCTAFNLSMTTFNLTQDRKDIDEIIKAYQDFQQKDGSGNTLAIMANCIGRCFIALQDWASAKEWLMKGLTHDDTIPQLYGNLARVSEQLGDTSGAAASFEQAKKLDPDYALKLEGKQT